MSYNESSAMTTLFLEASKDKNGKVINDGNQIVSNNKLIAKLDNPVSRAVWEDFFEQFCIEGLLQRVGSSGEVFKLTTKGLMAANALR